MRSSTECSREAERCEQDALRVRSDAIRDLLKDIAAQWRKQADAPDVCTRHYVSLMEIGAGRSI